MKNKSAVEEQMGAFTWELIIEFAQATMQELELVFSEDETRLKDDTVAILKYRIRYYAALTVMHTKPLKCEHCKAYNLIASVLQGGDFLIFGDWCLYYGLSDIEFIERWKMDKELQLVWTFFDTLYNKLASLRIIDNNTLKRYESSRASGHFLPYTERAIIADTASRTKILLDRGEEISRELLGDK